jgi:hypothetical protein
MKGGFLLFSTDQYDFVNATPEIFFKYKTKRPYREYPYRVNTHDGLNGQIDRRHWPAAEYLII